MIDFTQSYSRESWGAFLEDSFLPEDFHIAESHVPYSAKYTQCVTKLGECLSLELSVFEITHTSVNDARVGLSKEAFKLVCDYTTQNRALVLFVPEDTNARYRFSFVEFTPEVDEQGRVKRKCLNPRRYSYMLGEGCKKHTPEQMLVTKGRVSSPEDLLSRFAIDVVTKEFYDQLFKWYDEWAIHSVKFPRGQGSAAVLPQDPEPEANRLHLIRLITRLIFVWFLKQKDGLIPDWLFDITSIGETLKIFEAHSETDGNYYNGIIQNLFFATLNKEITLRDFTEKNARKDYGIKTVYRDHKDNPLFKVSHNEFVKKFETVPFLNGGLFECLDRREGGERQNYVDGFSREKDRAAFVPNALFFGGGGREGIIDLFKRYNFTVEENTPQDIDIALDPELLGKVFENLLGSYNEETRAIVARNESGSFYTPREIVEYMVDTSLKEYFKSKLNSDVTDIDKKLTQLFLYNENESEYNFNDDEVKALIDAIHNCKILDPACGSGAFPMGILNKLVAVMEKLDPDNALWKKIQQQKAIQDTEKAYNIGNKQERDERLQEISDVFEFNSGNYGRKLYLIENCIYGVDIQPIAIQISKLRFFISLIVEQKTGGGKEKNYNILPLPNLETKFVAANTLIGVKQEREQGVLEDPDIERKQQDLLIIRHKHFSARKAAEKNELRKQDVELSKELAELLKKDGFCNSADAQKMANWNPYDQTQSSAFFDAYWMFGIKDGFDVLIGNPPYKVIKRDDINKNIYESSYSYIKSGRINIYQLFFACAESLLCDTGCVVFIHPKTLFADAYLSATRKFLVDKFSNFTIINIVSRTDTFGAVLQSVAVSLWSKNQTTTECRVSEVIKKNDITELQYLYLSKDDIISPHKTLLISGNLLVYQIEKKLRNIETLPLNFITGSIEWNNYAAHLSGTKKAGSKRLIYGENIQRFYFAESRNRTGTTFISNKATVPVLNASAIFTQRTTAVEQPYRIIASIVDHKKFDTLIVSENGTNVFICSDIQTIHYILGILNSKLIDFYFRIFNSNTHVSSTELNRLPIIKPPKSALERITKLVNVICAAKAAAPQTDTSALERQIDGLVYRLYGLTYEEVKVVEPDFPLGRAEWEGGL